MKLLVNVTKEIQVSKHVVNFLISLAFINFSKITLCPVKIKQFLSSCEICYSILYISTLGLVTMGTGCGLWGRNTAAGPM